MKTILTSLYRNDIPSIITPRAPDDESKKLLDLICRHEDKLRHELSEDLLDAFEKYDACCSDLHSLSDERTFICGVRFDVRLIIEALSDD